MILCSSGSFFFAKKIGNRYPDNTAFCIHSVVFSILVLDLFFLYQKLLNDRMIEMGYKNGFSIFFLISIVNYFRFLHKDKFKSIIEGFKGKTYLIQDLFLVFFLISLWGILFTPI